MIQILRNKKSLTKLLNPTSCLRREAVEVPLSAYTAGQGSFNPFSSPPSESVEKADTLTTKPTDPHAVYTRRHPAGQILLPALQLFLDTVAILPMQVSSSCNANS
jgi:hypothetical protein